MLPKTNEYIKRAYKIACQHSFHKEKLSIEHCLMLVITEIAEAIEADRKDKQAKVDKFNEWAKYSEFFVEQFEKNIKDTFADELADIYIRLCDTAGMLGIEFERDIIDADTSIFFSSLSDKKRLTEKMFAIITVFTDDVDLKDMERIGAGLFFVEWLANEYDIDLAWHVEQKMKYNEMRVPMHGKLY